jgi:two-component system, cell cycle sensor histidine kinase and response regulator CckA
LVARQRVFVIATSVAGLGVLAWAIVSGAADLVDSADTALGLLCAAIFLAELFPLSLPDREEQISFSTPFAFALLADRGTAATVIAAGVLVTLADLLRRHPPVRVVFNAAQYALSYAAAGLVLSLLGGVAGTGHLTAGDLPALAVSAAVFLAVNASLASAPPALGSGTSLLEQMRPEIVFDIWSTAVLVGLAPIVLLVVTAEPIFFPLLALPLAATQVGARHAARSREISNRERTVLESVQDAVITVDGSGRIVDLNPLAEKTFGHVREAAVGRDMADLFADRTLQDALEQADGPPRRLLQTTARRADGTEFPADVVLAKLPMTGSPAAFVASVRDITEAKRAETALREQAGLLELTPDAVTVRDFDSRRLTFWNAGAERLYGYTAEQALGQNPHQLLQTRWPESRAAVEDSLARGGQWQGELVQHTADGREIVVLSRQAVQRHESGAGRAVLEIGTDITARKGLEEQLRQAQKLEAVGQLAGGVAHDFNNLLTVIVGYGHLASAKIAAGAGAEELAEVLRAADRAAELTRQLLAFSRRQVLDLVDLDVGEAVAGVLPLLRRLIGEDIAIVAHADPDVPHVLADRAQLEQVVMNLAVNARDAMPAGGTLKLETTAVELTEPYADDRVRIEPGSYVRLRVSDTGVGIPEDQLEHIFEPFYTTKEVGQGTGLGLATVFGIVEQSNGHVVVDSTPGVGTTFSVYLPVSQTKALAAAPAGERRPEPLPGSESILLCEDDDALRQLTELMLTDAGYRVHASGSPLDAVRFADSRPDAIDALVTDVIMPEMQGTELAQRVQALRPGLPVLFVSGYTPDSLRRRADLPEGSRLIAKPFDNATLLGALRQVLDEQRRP